MTGHPPTSCHTCIISGQSVGSSPVSIRQTHRKLFQRIAIHANDLHELRVSWYF